MKFATESAVAAEVALGSFYILCGGFGGGGFHSGPDFFFGLGRVYLGERDEGVVEGGFEGEDIVGGAGYPAVGRGGGCGG